MLASALDTPSPVHVPTAVAAENKLLYIFEPFPMVDTLTVVPVFLEFAGDNVLRLDFLRMVRFLRVIRIFRIFKLLRVLRMYRVLRLSDDGITRQVMTMVWTFVSIVFCSAGLIQIVGAWVVAPAAVATPTTVALWFTPVALRLR